MTRPEQSLRQKMHSEVKTNKTALGLHQAVRQQEVSKQPGQLTMAIAFLLNQSCGPSLRLICTSSSPELSQGLNY